MLSTQSKTILKMRKPKEPKAQTAAYSAVIVEKLSANFRACAPLARSLYNSLQTARQDAPDLPALVSQIEAAMLRGFSTREILRLVDRVGAALARAQRADFRARLKDSLGLDLLTLEPSLEAPLRAFAAENATLVKKLPSTLASEISSLTFEAVKLGTGYPELASKLAERLGISQNKARLLARDQASKLYSDLERLRLKKIGVARYTWRTAGDQRVRESHEKRDGKIFSWAQPPSDGHPGQAPLCRCYADPVFDA